MSTQARTALGSAASARSRPSRKLAAGEVHGVAEGVWTLQGAPGRSNVSFRRGAGDVAGFDVVHLPGHAPVLATLAPAIAWPGHGRPLSGDVRRQLERAAA